MIESTHKKIEARAFRWIKLNGIKWNQITYLLKSKFMLKFWFMKFNSISLRYVHENEITNKEFKIWGKKNQVSGIER